MTARSEETEPTIGDKAQTITAIGLLRPRQALHHELCRRS